MSSFKFKRRYSDTVKLVFSAYELSQKPIIYWANVGTIPKHSRLQKIRKQVKEITDNSYINGIDFIYYYGGSRLLHPFHVHWMDDKFEFQLFNVFGESADKFIISRAVKSRNERFTDEEIKRMNDYMQVEYTIVSRGYEMLKKQVGNPKNYNECASLIFELNKNTVK